MHKFNTQLNYVNLSRIIHTQIDTHIHSNTIYTKSTQLMKTKQHRI